MLIILEKRGNCSIQWDGKTESYMNLCRLPGFKRWDGRKLLFRPTGANITYFLETFPAAEWSLEARPFLDAYHRVKEEAHQIQNSKEAILAKDDFPYKTAPMDHQRRAFLISRDKKVFALLLEQGTGKSKPTIDNAAYLFLTKQIKNFILIAPKGVHLNWHKQEVPKHMSAAVPYESYFHRAHITGKARKRLEAMALSPALRIYNINIESTITKQTQKLIEELLEEPTFMVIDESSRIKNWSAKRTKYLCRIGEDAKYRRILNGTPVTRGPMDAYSQFYFLDPLILGYDTVTTYRARYCDLVMIPNPSGGHDIPLIKGFRNLDELADKVAAYSFRVLKKDCLDLPPKLYTRRNFDLTVMQQRVYDELRTEFISELRGNTLSEAMAMTRLLRLRQIACNWFPVREEKTKRNGDIDWTTIFEPIEVEKYNARLKLLEETLEDYAEGEGKIIIWATFRQDLLAISKLLGDRAARYYGGIPDRVREREEDAFKDPKNRHVYHMVANPQSGGLGNDWSVATTVIFYNNDPSLLLRLQAEDRAHRYGQVNRVTYIDLVANGTVDSRIIRILKENKDVADIITRDPRSFFMEQPVEED